MKALVTGITGFAGSHLAEHLLACGDHLLGSARAARWPAEVPPRLHAVPLIAWDIGHTEGLSPPAALQVHEFAPEVIYHLAACSVPGLCGASEPSESALATNVQGTARLLKLAGSLPSRPRLLLVSSSHVYGHPRGGYRVSETAPADPLNGYAVSKWRAEELARQAHLREGLDALVVRAFQHTGPRQREPMMLPQWARQFATGVDPVVVRNLSTDIDLTDVRDVVRAYRLLARHGRAGETYNVGSGSRQSTGDVFGELRRLADPRRACRETHPGPRHDPIAAIARLQRATGWRPRIPLATTIEDTYSYWLDLVKAGMLPTSQQSTT